MLQQRRGVSIWLGSLFLGSCLSLLGMTAAIAQTAGLSRAEVYRFQNAVELLLRNQAPRQARLRDVLAPRDAVRTGGRSRAELLFNEGSLARIGANTTFRFVPGMRRYQLSDGSQQTETIFQLRSGVAMVVSPPGGFGGGLDTRIETPGGQVELLAAALPPEGIPAIEQLEFTSAAMVIYDPESNQMQVLALTNDVRVLDGTGENAVLLQGGQTVTVTDGQLGSVQDFDLRQFYRTSTLAAGLGPGQEGLLLSEPVQVQETLRAVRTETLIAIARQEERLQGLCTISGRGADSTLAENCITTSADDPLAGFEDRREDTAEPPEVPIEVPVEEPIEVPVEEPPEEPIEVPIEEPVEEPIEVPILE